MEYIGVHEAKTNLSALLRRLAAGEEFVITNRGKEVAQLLPPQNLKKEAYRKAMDEFLALSSKPTVDATMEEVLKWRDEGRKG